MHLKIICLFVLKFFVYQAPRILGEPLLLEESPKNARVVFYRLYTCCTIKRFVALKSQQL